MERTLQLVLEFVNNATGPLEAAASAAQGVMGGLASGAQKTGGIMATVWENTGGRVIGALGSMIEKAKLASLIIGGSLVKGIQDLLGMAGEFERFGKAAEYLTGSAKGADEFAAATRRLANATMFNIDQIADLNIRLVGNTKNVKQSEGVLMSLSDAVAATGGGYAELESATRAWIQINSKATASSEELNRQLSNANIPALRVLAEHIVKDADSPLRQYIQTAGNAGGASKTLSKAFGTATENLPILAKQSQAAEAALKALKDKGTDPNSASFLRAEASVMRYHNSLDKAQGTIKDFNTAQSNINTTGKQAKLTVEQVMAQLQNLGDLKIPGTIMAAEITKALNEAYGGANKELIKTFQGQLSLLGDLAKQAALSFLGLDASFRPVKGGIIDLLTKALMPLVSWLQDHQEDIVKWAGQWAKSTPVLMGLVGFILGAVIPALWGILGPILLLGVVFGGLGALVGYVIDKMGGFQKVGKDIQGIWGQIVAFYQTYLVPFFEGLMNYLGPVFQQICAALQPALQNLWKALQNLAPVLGYLLLAFGALLTGVLTAIAAALPGIINMIAGFINFFVGIFNMFFGLIAGIFTGNWQMLHDGWNQFWQGVVQLLGGFIQAIWGLLKGFVDGIVGFCQALYDTLLCHSIIPDMVTAIINWFFNLDNMVIGIIANWVANIINYFIQLAATGIAYVTNMVNTVVNWATSMKDRFVSAVQSLADSVGNIFGGLASKAYDWGRGVISGIINGIKDAVRAAGKLADAVLSKLGISRSDLGFAHGGIVPGPVGAPVLATVHGGERIVPRSGVDGNGGGGGGTTVNFYGNMTVDSEERVKELADQIIRVMGRQNEFERYGAGY